jgi:hypothetical protein
MMAKQKKMACEIWNLYFTQLCNDHGRNKYYKIQNPKESFEKIIY